MAEDNGIIITDLKRKRALLTAIITANIVTMLNASSVNLTLPVFMTIFHATLNHVQWVMLSYVLSLACAMPLVSALCERFTYRRVFMTSLVAIGIFSTMCAAATSLNMLIGFRVLNGFFSGIVVSSTMALIYRYMPVHERAQQYASLLVIQSVAFAIGPSFAGLVMQVTSWRAIFILPTLFVVIAWIRANHALPVEEPQSGVKLQIFGVTMVSVATGMLLLAFTFVERWGFTDPRFLTMIAASVLIVSLFILHSRNNANPALDFGLFKLPSFALCIFLSLMLSTVMGITASVLAVYVQAIRDYLPVHSGAVQLAPALFMALANNVVKHIYNRGNGGRIAFFGFAIAGLGNGLMLLVGMNFSLVLLSMILCLRYIGIGCIRMPISDFGMTAVPQNRVSHASALINWTNQLSQAISTNILTVVFTWRANAVFRQNGGVGEAIAGQPGFNEAALSAFHLVFGIMAVLMVIGAILALFMKKIGRSERRRSAVQKEASQAA